MYTCTYIYAYTHIEYIVAPTKVLIGSMSRCFTRKIDSSSFRTCSELGALPPHKYVCMRHMADRPKSHDFEELHAYKSLQNLEGGGRTKRSETYPDTHSRLHQRVAHCRRPPRARQRVLVVPGCLRQPHGCDP